MKYTLTHASKNTNLTRVEWALTYEHVRNYKHLGFRVSNKSIGSKLFKRVLV